METTYNKEQQSAVNTQRDCDVYCPVCRKQLHVKAGQPIPRCCGKLMRILD